MGTSRRLGRGGLEVSGLGLGCMGMSQSYGPADNAESMTTIRHAIDLGITFLDTSDVYGGGRNEELVGRAFRTRRSEIQLATKFGVSYTPDRRMVIDGSPENVRRCIEASLRRLGTDHVDLYYLHRVDPTIPIEETIGAMAELVSAGTVGHLGLSEASANTLRRANEVHPIAALQSEWSLWTRDVEADVLGVARELEIGIVPYSPLGRGFLTGTISSRSELAATDVRLSLPRFAAGNFDRNRRLVEGIGVIASELGCTTGQLALAWLLDRGDDVVPIPGTKRRSRLVENIGALSLHLSDDVVDRLNALAPCGVASGDRYAAQYAYGDSPLPDAA